MGEVHFTCHVLDSYNEVVHEYFIRNNFIGAPDSSDILKGANDIVVHGSTMKCQSNQLGSNFCDTIELYIYYYICEKSTNS